MTSTRTPEHPSATTCARRSIMPRTSASPRSGPTPAAWLRTRLAWSARMFRSLMRFSASAPNPVLTPYTAGA